MAANIKVLEIQLIGECRKAEPDVDTHDICPKSSSSVSLSFSEASIFAFTLGGDEVELEKSW